MTTALSIAREFVRLSHDGEAPDPLSLPRLQWLLFLGQGWSLNVRRANLFPEKIHSRATGPQVQGIKHAVGAEAADAIGKRGLRGGHPLGEEEAAFVLAVWEAYRHLSVTGLSGLLPDVVSKTSAVIAETALSELVARLPVPEAIAAHRNTMERLEAAAKERLDALPPLDKEAFRAAAVRPKAAV
jgi:uncharacterized phage-associated protein